MYACFPGDAIDASLGGTFHLSTMVADCLTHPPCLALTIVVKAAAGLGNLVSDVAGLGLSNTIEVLCLCIVMSDVS
jgi:hypothetical protein